MPYCWSRSCLLLLRHQFAELCDDCIQSIPDSRVADSENAGHFLQAPAGAHETEQKFLIVTRQIRQRRKRETTFHFGTAALAIKSLHSEAAGTAWANGG